MKPKQTVYPIWTSGWCDGPVEGYCICQGRFCYFQWTHGQEDLKRNDGKIVTTNRIFTVYNVPLDLIPDILDEQSAWVCGDSDFYQRYPQEWFNMIREVIIDTKPVAWFTETSVDWSLADKLCFREMA
jgi:hypothetical protein